MTKACPTEFVCVRCRSSGISSFSCRLFRICGRVLFHLPYHTVFSLELLSIVCTRSAVRSTGPGPSESFCPPCFVGRQRRLRFDCSVLTESYANKCAHTLGEGPGVESTPSQSSANGYAAMAENGKSRRFGCVCVSVGHPPQVFYSELFEPEIIGARNIQCTVVAQAHQLTTE